MVGILFGLIFSQTRYAVGEKTITLQITDAENKRVYEETLTFHVIHSLVTEQTLIHTQWFHTDSLANYYEVDAFSNDHWQIVENFIKTAGENGINMIHNTNFHPSTNKIRRSVVSEQQCSLLMFHWRMARYTFDFSQLKRSVGKYVSAIIYNTLKLPIYLHNGEQKFTPKVMVEENGVLSRKFGWDVKADSNEYVTFLQDLLPNLTELLERKLEP